MNLVADPDISDQGEILIKKNLFTIKNVWASLFSISQNAAEVWPHAGATLNQQMT